MSNLNTILKQKLQTHKQAITELADSYGAYNLQVFGSVARGEAQATSDIDLPVEIDESRSLLDYIGFVQALASLLGCKVDVAQPETLHSLIREQVFQETVSL